MRLLVLAALLALAGAGAAQDGQRGFRKGLDKVWRRADDGEWEKARAELMELLAAHAKQPYVLVDRPHVLELARLCVLRAQAGEPDLAKLVSGKLLGYNPSTRMLRIEYTPGTMGDWVTTGSNQYHPASFCGSHQVRVEGKRYPTDGVQLVVCYGESNGYLVAFGSYSGSGGRARMSVPPCVLDLRDRKTDISTTLRSAFVYFPDDEYRVDLKVKATTLEAYADRKALLRAKKDRNDWGHVVVLKPGSFTKIRLEGRTEGAWVHGLIDGALQEKIAALEKSYDPRDHLPAWLFANGKPAKGLAVASRVPWPAALDEKQVTLRNRAWGLLESDKYRDCLDVCGDADTPLSAYYAGLAYEGLDDYDRALVLCRDVRKAYPAFFGAQLQEARLLALLRRRDEALAAADALLQRYPGDADLIAELAIVFLRGGLRDPRAIVEGARMKGVYSRELEKVLDILHKRYHGPAWPTRYETKSRHYRVVTDVSRGRAYRVAQAMERAYSSFGRLLAKPPKTDELFTVYFFRSQVGYARYLTGLYGSPHEGSAGLYDPTLKQLLLWNRTPEEDLLKTARHEGLHQFVDSVIGTPPLWFNEGLAEYFSYGDMERGVWVPGGKAARHRSELRQPFNLLRFLYLSNREFMANPPVNYARAWAFVHFLRESEDGRPLFDRFWTAFSEESSPHHALDRVLAQVDLKQVEAGFRAHVRDLW